VTQCFFITDPAKPSHVVVRRGKRNIIGMDGVANEEDLFRRRSHDVGLNYSAANKKGKKIVKC
jgi:hypothetical protein